MTQPGTPPPPPAEASPRSGASKKPAKAPRVPFTEKLRRFYRVVKLGAWIGLGGAVGYGVAALRGHFELTEQQERTDEQIAKNKESSSGLVRHAHLLTARRALHQSIMALDQRNFGVAETYARAAGKSLQDLGEQLPEYAELATALNGFRPQITDDVVAQRSELLALAKRFDQALDKSPLEF